LSYRGMLRVEL